MGGRKFWVTLIGMGLCAWKPEASEAVAAIVLTFNGANAAVSWAYARSDSTHESIETRREPQIGFDPAP